MIVKSRGKTYIRKLYKKAAFLLLLIFLLFNLTLPSKENLINRYNEESKVGSSYVNLPNESDETDLMHGISYVVISDTYEGTDEKTDKEDIDETSIFNSNDSIEHEEDFKGQKKRNTTTKTKDKGSRIVAEINNMYPGSSGHFEFELKNVGNTPAVLKVAHVDIDDRSTELLNKLYVIANLKLEGNDTICIEGPAAEMSSIINDLYSGIRLYPEETAKTQITIFFDRYGTLTYGDINENEKLIFDLTMNWAQT